MANERRNGIKVLVQANLFSPLCLMFVVPFADLTATDRPNVAVSQPFRLKVTGSRGQ